MRMIVLCMQMMILRIYSNLWKCNVKMIIAQLIYYFGIAVSTSYLTVSLRNHFMSNLSLNDGRIRFRSTLTYHGMLYRMCALVVISGITGGLAYPLLKIWMIDWQAKKYVFAGRFG